MDRKSSSKILAAIGLVAIAIVSSSLTVKCKSIAQIRPNSQASAGITTGTSKKDPIIAIPSEQYEHQHLSFIEPAVNIYEKQQHQPESQQVHYILQNQQPQTSEPSQYQPTATHLTQKEPTSTEAKQEVAYYVVRQDNQSNYPVNVEHQHDLSCKHKHEYVTLSSIAQEAPQAEGNIETTRDYPGEILYIGQDGDSLLATKSQPDPSPQNGQASSSDYSNVAEMISQNHGMPATILTEVPIKDMPYHVLEKLKKDYGVKVVATRERPGANLVINCDEQSNQENTICSKSSPIYTTNHNAPYSYVAEEHSTHSTGELDHENPQHLPEVPNGAEHPNTYETENQSEPPQGMYITRDGETRVASDLPTSEERANHRDTFGSRHNSGVGSDEHSVEPSAETDHHHHHHHHHLEEPSNSEHLDRHTVEHAGVQPETHEAQPSSSHPERVAPEVQPVENDPQQAGFDSPSASAEVEPSQKS